jgi:hypothetical protein
LLFFCAINYRIYFAYLIMKTSRRKFIATASLAAIGASTQALAKHQDAKLIHHVFFWLKNPDSANDKAKLLKGLQLLSKIESLRDFSIGIPAATERRELIDSTYDYSLFTVFDDVAGHDVYQIHPLHLEFVKDYQHLWGRVQVYDVQQI